MGGTTVRISPETFVSQAEATGFRPDMLEKVGLLLQLLDAVRSHPFLNRTTIRELEDLLTRLEERNLEFKTAEHSFSESRDLPDYCAALANEGGGKPKEILGVSYKIVSLRPGKFFGIMKDWIDEIPFSVTDREKTIIDGLDLPQYVGGVSEIAKALTGSWKILDEEKLRRYSAKIGNSAVAKRLGFIMETLGLGDVEALRTEAPLASGFSPLDPTMPRRGKYNRRWGLLVNAEIQP
jgi:hypothetical protein